MARAARIVLGILVALVVALAAGVYAAGRAPGVLAWLAAHAPAATAGRVTVETTSGSLFGPAELTGVAIALPSETVRIQRLRWSWQPAALLRGTLDIARLRLRGVQVTLRRTGGGHPAGLPHLPRLPLAVTLDALTIRNLEVTPARGRPFRIDRIDAGLRLHRTGRLAVQSLRLQRGPDHIRVHGDVGLRGDWPVHLSLRSTVALARLAPLHTAGSLRGSLAGGEPALHLQLQARAPWPLRATGTVTRPLGKLHWRARLRVQGLPLRTIRPGLPAARADLQASAEGSLHSLGGHARMELAAQKPDAPTGRIRADFSAGPGPMRLHLEWRRVRWARGKQQLASPEGSLRMAGRPSNYRITLKARAAVSGPAGTLPVALSASGQGGTRALRLDHFRARLLGGRVQGPVRVALDPAPRLRATLSGSGIDPAAAPGLGPGWKGAVAFHAALDARAGSRRSLRVEVRQLGGTLRGKPLAGSGTVAVAGDRLSLDGLRVRVGGTRLHASGHVGSRWALQLQASSADLGEVAPGLAGSARLALQVSGARHQPRVAAEAHLREVHAGKVRLHAATLHAQLGLERRAPLSVRLSLEHLQLAGRRVQSATLQASGTTASERIELRLQGTEGRAELALAGGLERDAARWRGRVTRLAVSPAHGTPWRLKAPAALHASRAAATLAQTCLQAGDSRVCLGGEWSAGRGERLRLTLQGLPLQPLQRYLPAGVAASGALAGNADLHRTAAGRLFGGGQIKLSGGRLVRTRTGTHEPPLLLLALTDARLDFQAAPGTGLRAHLHAGIAPGGKLDIDAALPRYDGRLQIPRGAPLQARVVADTSNLGLVSELVPELAAVRGRLHADLGVGGSLSQPVLSGGVAIAQASMEIPRLGLKLTGARITARARANDRIAFSGETTSGGGRLAIDGDVAYVQGQLRAQWHIHGKEFQAVDVSQASVFVSPDLNISQRGRSVKVDGEIRVPRARLTPREITAVVRPSPDQVLVGVPQQKQPRHPWRLDATLRLTVGDHVTFSAYGLKGDVKGNLLIRDRPGKPTSGSGELSVVNGQYKAYGQELTIDRGRLLFTGGPVSNPGLDIHATRSISEQLQVGLNVRGTLQQPVISLWSNQPITDADKLAYLVAGRPLGQAPATALPGQGVAQTPGSQKLGITPLSQSTVQTSTAPAASTGTAAEALGVKGGSLLAQRLGSELGVQDVSLESLNGGFQQTSLVIGKYLSPRLYISYGYGVFDAISSFRIRYQLSTRWTLKTQTGVNSSADFIYTIER